MKKYKSSRGITLIELIISTAILVIVILAVYSFTNFGQKTFDDLNQKGDLQLKAQNASLIFSKEIREAKTTDIGPSGSKLNLTTVSGENMSLYINSGNLVLENTSTGKADSLCTNVKSITFANETSGIRITMVLENGKQGFTDDSMVYKRN